MSKLERYLSYKVHGRTSQPQRKQPKRETGRGPLRDEDFKSWIRTLPSLASGHFGCECCHFGTDGGLSQKASDSTCGPLTPAEHREYHQIGKRAFERKHGLDLEAEAARLHAEWITIQKRTA